MFIKTQLSYLCLLLEGAPLAQVRGEDRRRGVRVLEHLHKAAFHTPLGLGQPLQQGDQICLMIRTDGCEN